MARKLDDAGSLTVSGSTLSGNSGDNGGGIYIEEGGVATVSDCTLSGNSAQYCGGIVNSGSLSISDCTLSGNSCTASDNFGVARSDYVRPGLRTSSCIITHIDSKVRGILPSASLRAIQRRA